MDIDDCRNENCVDEVNDYTCHCDEDYECVAGKWLSVLGDSMSHHSHDDDRARQRHNQSQPTQSMSWRFDGSPSCLGGSSHGWDRFFFNVRVAGERKRKKPRLCSMAGRPDTTGLSV